jgi:8-oxo-dGTP pyrophosphatase MutT (NUDIX family)/CRISPR/Cas system-associated exonuclease Cas4 (RecB family)
MRQKYAIAAHVFLTNAHGEVLFMRRANTGYADGKWSVAAGHVEANETFVACALRELKEEAGLQLKPASLKPVLVQQKRDFDEQELREEKFVKPTLIGVIDNKKAISFNLENAHPRDSRIKFYPEPHIYTIDNAPVPSASTVVSKFFPEFDSYSAARRLNPSHELYGLKVDEIVEIWNRKGKEAANKGTFLHEQIECFYLNQEYTKTEEFHLFEDFVNDNSHIKPYRTEWRIFDERFHIAGTVDLISKNGNIYEMYDWKRSKKVVNSFNGQPIKNNPWQNGVGQLADIDDTSYNRYCLQQSLYKFILEKNYGIKVSNMYLIVLYPKYSRYYKVEVPYLKDKAEYILRTL